MASCPIVGALHAEGRSQHLVISIPTSRKQARARNVASATCGTPAWRREAHSEWYAAVAIVARCTAPFAARPESSTTPRNTAGTSQGLDSCQTCTRFRSGRRKQGSVRDHLPHRTRNGSYLYFVFFSFVMSASLERPTMEDIMKLPRSIGKNARGACPKLAPCDPGELRSSCRTVAQHLSKTSSAQFEKPWPALAKLWLRSSCRTRAQQLPTRCLAQIRPI